MVKEAGLSRPQRKQFQALVEARFQVRAILFQTKVKYSVSPFRTLPKLLHTDNKIYVEYLLQEWLAETGHKRQLDGLVVSGQSKHKHEK